MFVDDRYDLELHMLHMNTDKQTGKNKTAVIAVLYKIGKPNAFLSKVVLATLTMITIYSNYFIFLLIWLVNQTS